MPAVQSGTEKEALKLPLASVEIAVGLVVTGTPLYLMIVDMLGLKPVPVTVTVVPGAPVVGEIVIFCSTVKLAIAELALTSWAFMVWLPREVGGIVKVLLVKLPVVLVVVVTALAVTVSR